MYFYAQLNENNICIGVSQLSGPVQANNMVEVPSFDLDCVWRKYENGQWSEEKYEPQSTGPLTEFEEVKLRLELAEAALNDLILGEA